MTQVQDTNINAYYRELEEANEAVLAAQSRVEQLKQAIRDRGGELPGEPANEAEPVADEAQEPTDAEASEPSEEDLKAEDEQTAVLDDEPQADVVLDEEPLPEEKPETVAVEEKPKKRGGK